MREIKFRARNAGLPRCWIYGYFVIENGTNYIINQEGKFKVIAGSIDQYIGFKDKNGREIYGAIGENGGDILGELANVNYRWVVIWKNCGWYADNVKYGQPINDTWNDMEVIGNIYENPELLVKRRKSD